MLEVHSSYFRTIFTQDTGKDRKSYGPIELVAITIAELETLLHFLYFGYASRRKLSDSSLPSFR